MYASALPMFCLFDCLITFQIKMACVVTPGIITA